MWVNTEIKDFANADTRLCNVWSREYGENLFRMDVSRNLIMMPCCGCDKLCLSKIFLISKMIAVSGQRSIVSDLCKGKQRTFHLLHCHSLKSCQLGLEKAHHLESPGQYLSGQLLESKMISISVFFSLPSPRFPTIHNQMNTKHADLWHPSSSITYRVGTRMHVFVF